MTKGTSSMGKKSGGKNHIYCRRCGQRSRHISTGICSSCSYGKSTKLKSYKWKRASKR